MKIFNIKTGWRKIRIELGWHDRKIVGRFWYQDQSEEAGCLLCLLSTGETDHTYAYWYAVEEVA